MKRPLFPARSFLLTLLACSGCGGGEHVDISTITNETAHQAATEVAAETEAVASIDSLPTEVADSLKESQSQRQTTIQQALKDSKYATMSDRALDSLRQAWLTGYANSCDPADLQRINASLRTDEVLKQWAGNNVDSAVAYHARLMAVKSRCEAGRP